MNMDFFLKDEKEVEKRSDKSWNVLIKTVHLR